MAPPAVRAAPAAAAAARRHPDGSGAHAGLARVAKRGAGAAETRQPALQAARQAMVAAATAVAVMALGPDGARADALGVFASKVRGGA